MRASGRGSAQLDASTGRFVRVSDALCRLLGYSERELLQRKLPDLALPEDRAGTTAALSPLLEAGADDLTFEVRCRCKDGGARRLQVTGVLVRDVREQPARAVLFVEDIGDGGRSEEQPLAEREAVEEGGYALALDVTALRRIEDTFRQGERIFRAIGDSIDYGIWVSDREGRNLYASGAFLRMAGMTQAQCTGDGWIAALHPDDRHKLAIFERCVETGEPFEEELRYIGADGAVHPVVNRGVPVRDERDEITCWVGLCLDVSRLKRTEEALRESERRLRAALDEAQRVIAERERLAVELRRSERQLASVMENSPDVIFRLDLEMRCLFVTSAVEAITGRPPAHYIGRGGAETALPADLCEASDAACREARATGKQQRIEFAIGERRFRTRFIPELGPDGAVESFLGICEDVTAERLAAEERQKLLESERAARDEAERVSRVKDDFVATLSHELRSPINAILGWARILRNRAHDPQALARGIEVIERNARLQSDMVSELLDMSRIVSGKLRLDVSPFDLPSVIQSAIESIKLAADAKGIEVASRLDPEAAALRGDPARIHQVVWNLLSNAVKFTPSGGRIDVALRRAGAFAEVTVTDTGAGIAPQFLPHLFERFRQADASSTRQYGGLGIGLSIVKHLVELHGGAVAVASAGEGKGAAFTVRL
ncbi:hybrid sensor histidine kinase/response regulator, partial [Sorangium cellulosum]